MRVCQFRHVPNSRVIISENCSPDNREYDSNAPEYDRERRDQSRIMSQCTCSVLSVVIASSSAMGSEKLNVLPAPGLLVTSMELPILSRISLTMDRPTPAPPNCRVELLST